MRIRYSGWRALRTRWPRKDNLVGPDALVQELLAGCGKTLILGGAALQRCVKRPFFMTVLAPLKWLHCIFPQPAREPSNFFHSESLSQNATFPLQ